MYWIVGRVKTQVYIRLRSSALAVLLLSFLSADAQNQNTIEIDTTLVVLPVTVVDRQSRYVSGLEQNDFRVFEDGVEQKVIHFETGDTSSSVLIVLDRSGSMVPHYQALADAANALVGELNAKTTVSVVSFANDTNVVADWKLKEFLGTGFRIRAQRDDFTTYLYDAVDRAIKRVRKRSGRKAIVLFSDGVGGERLASAKSNLRDAIESDAAIFTVRYTPAQDPTRRKIDANYLEVVARSKRFMTELASASGGRALEISEIDDLAKTFREIGAEISRQYLLGYYPSREGKKNERRKIKVHVAKENIAVITKNEIVYR